jgi:hypothetical protein
MKAEKVTVTITVECLSIQTVGGLTMQAIEMINKEAEEGSLSMDDGDQVKWETKREKVEF